MTFRAKRYLAKALQNTLSAQTRKEKRDRELILQSLKLNLQLSQQLNKEEDVRNLKRIIGRYEQD